MEEEKTLEDDVGLKTPSLAKLTGRINRVIDTLALVPVHQQQLGQVKQTISRRLLHVKSAAHGCAS